MNLANLGPPLAPQGGDADAVFLLESGATLKNAIIGKDQIEGVHCKGACTVQVRRKYITCRPCACAYVQDLTERLVDRRL